MGKLESDIGPLGRHRGVDATRRADDNESKVFCDVNGILSKLLD